MFITEDLVDQQRSLAELLASRENLLHAQESDEVEAEPTEPPEPELETVDKEPDFDEALAAAQAEADAAMEQMKAELDKMRAEGHDIPENLFEMPTEPAPPPDPEAFAAEVDNVAKMVSSFEQMNQPIPEGLQQIIDNPPRLPPELMEMVEEAEQAENDAAGQMHQMHHPHQRLNR